jgi:hypothetical protein
MGRVLFPTGNQIGVRTLSGELGSDYVGFRSPAEAAPRAAQNPVTLGVAVSTVEYLPSRTYWGGNPPRVFLPLPPVDRNPITSLPIVAQPTPKPPIVAPPVIQQVTPTPQVTIPPAAPTPPIVTTGGGTVTPAAAPAAAAPAPAAASTGFMDSVAAWLGGTTPIGTWSVPNALLAGAVILGFAFLESGGSSTGRKR